MFGWLGIGIGIGISLELQFTHMMDRQVLMSRVDKRREKCRRSAEEGFILSSLFNKIVSYLCLSMYSKELTHITPSISHTSHHNKYLQKTKEEEMTINIY